MKIIEDNFHDLPKTVVALGKFDAIHLGHAVILNTAVKMANKEKLSTLVYSFDMHSDNYIITKDEKTEILDKMGINYLFYQEFSENFKNMSAQDFFFDVLVKKCNAKYIVVGDDWHFGKNREGDIVVLAKLCVKNGIGIDIVRRLKYKNEVISSTLIRKYICAGEMRKANLMLGRCFSITSKVTFGKQLGSKIGFPTANFIADSKRVTPKRGVYATRAFVDNKPYRAMTNVGLNPTVDNDNKIHIETNIFGFDEDIYNKVLKIEFLEKIRDEVKFSSVDILKKQLVQDKMAVNTVFSKIF